MKHLLVLLIFIFLSPPTLASAKFDIQGVGKTRTKQARRLIKKALAKSSSLNAIQRSIQALYNSGHFSAISVYKEKGTFIYRLKPVTRIGQIVITGNSHHSTSDILAKTEMTQGEVFSEDDLQRAVNEVQKFYNLSGYLNAQVVATTKEKGNRITVRLKIKEKQPCLIKSLSFTTPNLKLNKSLNDLVEDFGGKRFTQEIVTEIENSIKSYLFDKRYYGADLVPPEVTYNPLKTEVALGFDVSDPYIYTLEFEGNKTFTRLKLINELSLTEGSRLSGTPVEDLSERLAVFYRSEGYANIDIKSKEYVFEKDFVRRLTFKIKEGAKVRVASIKFDGSFSKKEEVYAHYIEQNSGPLMAKGYFNSEELEQGVKNLVTHLQNNGFIAAHIPGTRVDFDTKREKVDIKITLDEGPQTFIKEISFKGIKNISVNELQQTIGLEPGKPLELNTLEASFKKIENLYRDRGYLEVQVNNEVKNVIKYSAFNTKADLHFSINEGPLIRVSQIVVEGNIKTKDFVIRRELEFQEGQILTPQKISDSQDRLQTLGLFSSVQIRHVSDDVSKGEWTVIVQVTEGNPGFFVTGIGVNNELELTVKASIGASYNNIGGTGRGINGRVELANKVKYKFLETNIALGYTEPYVFGTNNKGMLSLSQKRKIFQVDNPNDLVYATDSTKGTLSIERQLFKALTLNYEVYGFARTNTFEIDNKVASEPLDIATLGPKLSLDLRDDIFNPTRGSFSTLAFEYSGPELGSTPTVNYYKTIAGHTQYISFWGLTWANEVKGGYLKNISELSNGAVPRTRAFILGGRSTIRGFNGATESFPSRRDDAFLDGIKTDSYFILTKSEIRFPIYGILGGAVFYDGGKVGFQDFNPVYDWRDSVGAGIRINTPVGPLSIDYGFKLNRDRGRAESIGAWHISIGVF